MKTDYCAYPPRIAVDVEISEQRDGDRPAFIVGSSSVGRYLLLRTAEYRALQMLGEELMPAAICMEFSQRYGGTLTLMTLTKFLARLDETGILTGERGEGHYPPEQQLSARFYTRFKLFNPDPLFTRIVDRLGWIWTTRFFVSSLLLMLTAVILALMNEAEVAQYGSYILREHYVAIIVAGLVVGVTHEFAHGLTCKAFGGRATEVGALLIYYFLPAFYCNVSGIHMIPQRGRRLWVIAAGVYWQLLVGTLSLLSWFALAPYTPPADLFFIFFCGSVLDVAFNGNPLIKLDGYYFLSQWLRLPNLMDRASEWRRGLLRRIVFGVPNEAASRFNRREQAILAVFGLLSFVYTLALRLFIVIFLGSYLTDWFNLTGLLGAAALALFYVRRPLRELIAAAISALRAMATDFTRLFSPRMEVNMAIQDRTTQALSSGDAGRINAGQKTVESGERVPSGWRRRLVPLAIFLFVVLILCLPWNASVGAYGALIAVPGQEAIIRAPESATLLELSVRPGDLTTGGAVLGRMGNAELEGQLAQAQAELDRAKADYDRLLGELKAREESIARAGVKLRQSQLDYDESDFEQRQIEYRRRAEPARANLKYMTASMAQTGGPVVPPAGVHQSDRPAVAYPAAIAVLQSDADLRHARLTEADLQLDRARKLYADGIAPRSELDAAETRASTLAIEFTAARQRLEAALVEHRRRRDSLATEARLARSDVGAERLQAGKLNFELRSARDLVSTLEVRRYLLRGRLAQLELVAPRAGAVFGDDLPRLVGQYFPKGAEICRVSDTRQLLARIHVPEREIGDVRVGRPVRLKVSSHPDQVFRGRVSKIGGESETDQNNQVGYRVEMVIENTDDLLRPGMTAFARIDFGRRMIGRILLHKLRQALRPELWMI
ncbi:MAG TPA: HlyD family efflux transporter periplasmic adaptor subunit [Blastocatellia bacterium]|jgi:putative peptide zinc metalloprotease protein|nr:HlyD family efflux transporter periplasmic adaptor subunit [Blastocatellia bacterium]